MSRVIFAGIDSQTARAYRTMGRGDSGRAFRATRCYSRMVRVLRVAVPGKVMLSAAFVMLVNYFNPLRMLDKLPVNVRKMVASASKITMEQPHLSRFTPRPGVYEFTAGAAQDMTAKHHQVEGYSRQGADAGQQHDDYVGGEQHL